MSNTARDFLIKPWSWRKWSNDHIGIGIGNTSTYVSVMEDNKAKLFKRSTTTEIVPSNKGPSTSNWATWGIKQLLGIKFDDPLLQKIMDRDPYIKFIVKGPDGYAWFDSCATGHLRKPSALLADVLRPMRVAAESHLGKSVSNAVVALPYNLTDSQITATLEVCVNAGICGVQTVDEAVAAAIAYEMHNEKAGTVFAVVNLGSRNFHVSLLELDPNGKFVGKGLPKSDMFLGGVEFDNVIMEFMRKELKRIEGKDLIRNVDLCHCRIGGEDIKMRFSDKSAISLPLKEPSVFTRYEFERLVTHLIERIQAHCVNCLKDAHVTAKDVDEVLLVGGMANVLIVQKVVTEVFGKSPRTGLNPEDAVALGAAAAIQAGVLGEHDWDSPKID